MSNIIECGVRIVSIVHEKFGDEGTDDLIGSVRYARGAVIYTRNYRVNTDTLRYMIKACDLNLIGSLDVVDNTATGFRMVVADASEIALAVYEARDGA